MFTRGPADTGCGICLYGDVKFFKKVLSVAFKHAGVENPAILILANVNVLIEEEDRAVHASGIRRSPTSYLSICA